MCSATTDRDGQADVLVVGAGPVGLGMAIELGSRGLSVTLIEQGDGTIEHPRTGLIAVRTMELARRWGLADDIRNAGFPPDYELSMVFCTDLNGKLIAKEPYPSMRDTPTPPETPEKKQRCPQSWMQPVLAKAAADMPGVEIRHLHRLEGFSQDKNGVTARVFDQSASRERVLRAKYMVACDGAGSMVREGLGIELEGRLLSYSINILFRAPNLVAQHAMGEAERYIFTGPDGTWGNLTVVDGSDTWRITVLGSHEKMDLDSFDAASWVRRAFGDAEIPFEILSVVPWRRSEMLAKRFREGRIILAGDAVHTTSPTGGMGMNTGMQEVLDLGWKLEGTLRGWGGPELLASYEIERHPVAARNLGFSTANFNAWKDVPDTSAICDDTEEGEALRASVGGKLRASTRVEWESLGLQIGHRYDESPICIPDDSPPTPDDYRIYLPTARPGARAPHAWLADGRSTLDLFHDAFVLMVFDEAEGIAQLERAFADRGVPLRIERIDQPEIAALYETALVLVRPDGHVAWRGAVVDGAEAIVDRVRGAGDRAADANATPRQVMAG